MSFTWRPTFSANQRDSPTTLVESDEPRSIRPTRPDRKDGMALVIPTLTQSS
ncbi:hypothetical protein BDV32DRAFT_131925 [Aspergillus pseudonomiae]|nr:hypothetical protein BDV32DRAFT_131925 [Aspergillus pseudonomiae]